MDATGRGHALMVEFALEPNLSAAEFQAIPMASTLAERRPAQDLVRLEKMLRQADLIVTARDGGVSWASRGRSRISPTAATCRIWLSIKISSVKALASASSTKPIARRAST